MHMTYTSPNSVFDGHNKSTLNTMHFDRNPFHVLMRRGQQSLNGLKFGTFTGRFPSDGVASVAVKELNVS